MQQIKNILLSAIGFITVLKVIKDAILWRVQLKLIDFFFAVCLILFL